MPEATQPIPATQPHHNHGLFSDHYLNVTLPERHEWKGLVEQARPVMEGISRTFHSYTPSDIEAQTEEDLVRPVLRLLGHDFPYLERGEMNELRPIVDALEVIAAELEALRILKEHELGVRLEHGEHGPYVPVNTLANSCTFGYAASQWARDRKTSGVAPPVVGPGRRRDGAEEGGRQ